MNNADMPAMPSGVRLDDSDPQSMYHPNGVMQCHGLTKREMMAMHMMAACQSKAESLYKTFDDMANDAVNMADSLLAELERTCHKT